jgi:rhodanese-related sulfurtransferase
MKSIGTPELQSMFARGEPFTLMNVLPARQFRVTQIPGAKNIPLDEADFITLAENCAGSRDATVVVYSADSTCDMANRAAIQLEAAGFSHVYAYSGGAKAWHANGGVLV